MQPTHRAEIEELHRRCGVFTKPEIAGRILDAIGWREDADLRHSRLLEPAAGQGAFIVEAARRLIVSYRRYVGEPTSVDLAANIRAFELHRPSAQRAGLRVAEMLRDTRIHHKTADALACGWVANGDFLLTDLSTERFTHVAGNPPYIRWSKIPPRLRAVYASQLPREFIGGDLFLPFLDRALDHLGIDGSCGFLCSDRWRFMAFADGFRRKWLPRLEIKSEEPLNAIDAFVTNVDAYPTILVARRTRPQPTQLRAPGIVSRKTLAERGYLIKVGPALGHTPAFVLQPREDDVEAELLRPWIDGTEIHEGAVDWRGRRVITMYGDNGKLIEPARYPLLMRRLKRFKAQLSERSIVRNGAAWFRPIDRILAHDWERPKLVIPELAKIPRVAIDRSGAIPSHGVYAIFGSNDDVECLYESLRDGQLAKALANIAPQVKGGYFRCYRRFLMQVQIG